MITIRSDCSIVNVRERGIVGHDDIFRVIHGDYVVGIKASYISVGSHNIYKAS